MRYLRTLGGRLRSARRAGFRPRSWCALSLLFLFLAAPTGSHAQQAQGRLTDQVKAGFLYNFTRYASWPEGSTGLKTLTFCNDNGAIDASVFKSLGGQTVGDRVIRTQEVDSRFLSGAVAACDVMFVNANADPGDVAGLAGTADLYNILLVSDLPAFARRGGHIELYVEDKSFKFRVNLDALKRGRLMLSSKVLRLAEIVQ